MLAATVALSVEAKSCSLTEKYCRQLHCTVEIVRGNRDPGPDRAFRLQVLDDARKSIEKLKHNGVLVAYTDGAAAVSDLRAPDAAHPGTWWAQFVIYRAINYPWPRKVDGSDAQNLPGVAEVNRASLKYCSSKEKVCC